MVAEVDEYREKLVEAVAEYDDTLLEKYFEDPNSISEAELMEAIRKATIDISIIPMLCGSAFKNKGIQRLLDSVIAYLPSPLETPPVVGTTLGQTKKRQEHQKNPSHSVPWLLKL